MQRQHPGQPLALCLSKAALTMLFPLWGGWQGSPAASWPQAAILDLQSQHVDPACLIQGAVASGAPEQTGRVCHNAVGATSSLGPWRLDAQSGILQGGMQRRRAGDSLGLVYLMPCWELAGGTELWKLICQVKPGALEVHESFPSGLSCVSLSSTWCPLHHICGSCVLGYGIPVPPGVS